MRIVTEKILVMPDIHASADVCSQMSCGNLNCSECVFDANNYDDFKNLVNRDEFYVTRKEED
jgi:hypothetical protein